MRDVHAGELLRAARQAAGVGLRELAARTSFHYTYLGQLERGVRPVRPEHIDAYEQALGVAIDRLASVAGLPRTVDRSALADLASILATTRRLEDRTSARAVLPAVTGFSLLARTLADEARGDVASPALALASEIAQYRGWLLLATGAHRHGVSQLDTAISAGQESGVGDRLSTGLSFKAYAMLSFGDLAAGRDLTRAALAQRRAHPAILCYDRFQLARVHAMAGEHRQSEVALGRAVRAAARLHGEPPASVYWYTQGFWAMMHALVLGLLGHHQDAADMMAAGIAALPADQRQAEWVNDWAARHHVT
jgi:transcriptional regulator with XRE-family HTH domain